MEPTSSGKAGRAAHASGSRSWYPNLIADCRLLSMNQIIVNADLGAATISRHIYGHFAEHLGRCIYGGFWVGEGSPIPNTRGIRNDVVEALRAVRIPNLRWPGGCFAD